jgi:hypothetical protein
MRRLSLASCVAVAAVFAASASPAGAAVTIGETFTPPVSFGGSGVFIQSSSPGSSYAVPSDGVITSWSFEAAAGSTPPLKLKIVRHAGGNDFTTIGDSQLETPTPSTLNTWTTRIAVRAGDLLAHFYSDTTFSYRNVPGYGTNEISGSPGDPNLDPPPGTTITYEPPSATPHQIDVSAVVEPDVDRDGFGDESQDKCVGTPGTANGCPSAVTIDKLKQKGDTKVKVTATVPGAGTLQVGSASGKALAGKAAKSLKVVQRNLTATTKQRVTLKVKLTKSAIGQLVDVGKLKLKVKAVYTPPGGPPGSQTKQKKLRS